ncbi:MAG: Cu2+-exporting ATPase [Limisphaerales bacterium]|nr:MAG: Cu2+-exporting ATPase [Limisphaerales bacterium]KAG0508196.1 MAG: Cu2+-exporting ATPase [Limisphaerales bacterium]TXT51392.1 MAG: Cu2+-exporting ATPase [Limisphaerales bacterium]
MKAACFHCGAACGSAAHSRADKSFCCAGCLAVFELLTENGLAGFYQLAEQPGIRVAQPTATNRFAFLDEPAVRARLVDFADDKLTRVTFHLPAIHCIACVWLLENLFRLLPGIGQSQVNFARKEAAVAFDPARVKLSEVAALLASLGYEPELKLADLDAKPANPPARRLWLQLGVAGFAFGNAMFFAITGYFGLDAFTGPQLKELIGWLNLLLAVPVVAFSAADYYRSAWASLRQRLLNIDVPIAAGIVAIFAQSVWEVASGRGEGYFDSLCGLIFFLLCGKLFQQKTYNRLAFDRDYKSFFPLSVTRVERRFPNRLADVADKAGSETGAPQESRVSLSELAIGDHLLLRNGELIPADAKLLSGPALIDYSFVTGESEPLAKQPGDYLYAGGRQMGGAIEVETVKPVSQSYLTSLWNQDAFRKDRTESFNALTNAYSQRFTKIILTVAVGAAVFWAVVNPAKSLNAFTAVLIVACPCALALAAPFALGSAQRVLGRRNVFLKNPFVLETLARVNAIVFDKTGTLTAAGAGSVTWQGAQVARHSNVETSNATRAEGLDIGMSSYGELTDAEERWLYSMTRHSTHPLAVRIGEAIAGQHFPEPVRSFLETTGCGMEGQVDGHEIWAGSAAWLESRGVACSSRRKEAPSSPDPTQSEPPHVGSYVHVAIDGRQRGCFVLASALRSDSGQLITELSSRYELALLSGDNERERERFRALFGSDALLQFNQSPLDKLDFIKRLQRDGKTVMMVGDGLNDAGALKQADVGVAVVESVSAFSPASDIIASAQMVPRLAEVLRYAKQSVATVRAAFLISTIYNIVGVSIAASGNLSPVVCAILMPLSSVSVVAFACGMTAWLGRKLRDGELRVESRCAAASQLSTLNPQLTGGAA